MQPLFDEVSKELILVSAYFVPTSAGVDYLTQRAESGVSVRLLTNSLEATDVPAVHAGYAPYRLELLEHGVKLYELRADPDQRLSGAPWMVRETGSASLHSKAAVFDQQKVFVGSLNFDPRSVLWNTEVGIIVDSPELADQVRRLALASMSPSVSYQVKIAPGSEPPKLIWIGERGGKRVALDRERATSGAGSMSDRRRHRAGEDAGALLLRSASVAHHRRQTAIGHQHHEPAAPSAITSGSAWPLIHWLAAPVARGLIRQPIPTAERHARWREPAHHRDNARQSGSATG